MNTNFHFALYMRFQSPTVELKVISEDYLGLKPATAMQRARAGSLPLPTFKMLDSERSPTLVSVDDLGNYMAKRHKMAEEEWQSVQPR